MAYANVKVPQGEKITVSGDKVHVPNQPIIPFIEGDGTGRDIWRASVRVFDTAVEKAYSGARKIAWMEVYAGEKAFTQFNSWLPDDTIQAFREFLVGIKGPLTTPIGGGIRSLNVALRQMLDLYVCLRPVRWFHGGGVSQGILQDPLSRKHRNWHQARKPRRLGTAYSQRLGIRHYQQEQVVDPCPQGEHHEVHRRRSP